MPRIAIAVNDYAAAVRAFDESFGMPVLDMSDLTVPSLGAHVGMCVPDGGSNIELMSPATPTAPLAQSLQRFLDRRGEGLYALMLEAADPDAEALELADRGLDVLPLMAGAGGRDLHPRSTHGVLIRVYPDGSVDDQGPHRQREPYLTGITTVIVATADAHKAAEVYNRGLGLDLAQVDDDLERGVTAATIQPANGGRIELVSAIDTTAAFARRIDDHVTQRGPGMFALALRTEDVESAVATLARRGVAVDGEGDLGPEASIFGTRFLIRPH